MKFLVYCATNLVLLLTIVSSEDIVLSEAEKDEILNCENGNEAFHKYMANYGYNKLSSSPALLKKQRKSFLSTFNEVKKHNKEYAEGKSGYKMALNLFSIMNKAQRNQYLGLSSPNTSLVFDTSSYRMLDLGIKDLSSGLSSPSSKDLKHMMTEVKQQGSCGACWAFPTTAVVEYAYTKLTGIKKSFSAQELLDCTYESISGRNGCEGGNAPDAWKHVIDKDHLASYRDYPYTEKDGRCKYYKYVNSMRNVMKVKGYAKVASGSENAVITAMQTNPLAVGMHVEDAFYKLGANGAYDGCDWWIKKQSNHMVTMTGYGRDYWEIRNSWGKDWANKGYGRLTRRNDICNILSDVYYIKYTALGGKGEGGDKAGEFDVCKDKFSNCRELSAYCNDKYNPQIGEGCPKTCGTCKGGNGGGSGGGNDANCKDKYSNCADYKAYCKTDDDVKTGCTKTCGTCGGGNSCTNGLTRCSDGVCRHAHMC